MGPAQRRFWPRNYGGNSVKVAILDDYQNVALQMADWSRVADRAAITVFNDHFAEPDAVVGRLLSFDVICVMRERTPLPREVIELLPRLKLIASTGPANASIDMAAAEEHGVAVTATGYSSTAAVEMTWALILASARHIVTESQALQGGGWQSTIGRELRNSVLGVVGLGNIGGQVARIGLAFGMTVLAWSPHLSADAAHAAGAEPVTKDDLFRRSDVVTIHLGWSERTRGVIGAGEFAVMKPTSLLVNTSRGPIVDEAALIAAVTSRTIAAAAVDVFDTEPLPVGHPLRHLDNVLATPNIGFVTDALYRTFYGDSAAAIAAWLDQSA
jgi:phosphoglycerate dehydrogenase-like enzyme